MAAYAAGGASFGVAHEYMPQMRSETGHNKIAIGSMEFVAEKGR